MLDLAKETLSVNIEDELQQSYLDYAMSVIVGRALPDVRDGLKPVHRRALYAMHVMGNDWNKPYKKSARIVGDVIGKYHPHGDTAVYDTIVRMAQPFSLRYVLVDGQGNFGSVDGDAPAAMRYTEIRMAKITQTLLTDLEKETVNFVPNYDENESEPTVLPARLPNLLVNGSSGIAVGMATNIPPHNLSEVIHACLALIDHPSITVEELIQKIPGPDFPTAGIIHGTAGIVEAYRTGRGRIYVRARIIFEEHEKTGKRYIVVTQLPYQVNKAHLIEKIAELVKNKKIEGITTLRDESDKEGMRVVIEIRRGDVIEVVLNNLYAQTQLQTVFGINMVALVDGQPKLLSLKNLLEAFIRHRKEVVTRRTQFELRETKHRAHILEGLAVALVNIDAMIALIKSATTPQEAREKLLAAIWTPGTLPQFLLLKEYTLSPVQVQAILDLKLQRLTGLEQDKIVAEYQSLLHKIEFLQDILNSPEKLLQVIREELQAIQTEFGDARKTEIMALQQDLTMEDLITDEALVVTLSHDGYVKAQPLTAYQAQHRGGKGKSATTVKEEDFIDRLLIANAHDTILCFSNAGKVYWLKTYQLPQASRGSKGKPIVNLLPLSTEEKINAILAVKTYETESYVVMATAQGLVKKTALSEFSRPRTNGIIAIHLSEGDKVVGVDITQGSSEIMLFSNAGKVIRFHEKMVRTMGRGARGVRGMRLKTEQSVISLVIAHPEGHILTATSHGYGKRTSIADYPIRSRGGQGVISIQVNTRNGAVIGAVPVLPGEEIMLVSDQGKLVRIPVDEVSIVSRNTQGVRLIGLDEAENLVAIEKVVEKEEA